MSAPLLTFAILFSLTSVGLLLPILLWRSSRTLSRAEGASAVLRDKLAQVARDRDAGLIGADEAIGAEAEISRALIAASRETESTGGPPRSGGWVGIALRLTCAAPSGDSGDLAAESCASPVEAAAGSVLP